MPSLVSADSNLRSGPTTIAEGLKCLTDQFSSLTVCKMTELIKTIHRQI